MTLDKSNYNLIQPNPTVQTCNCCCNKRQQQQVGSLGIFGFGYPAQPTFTNNFNFNPFGMFQGFNFPQISFNMFSGLNFDFSKLWTPFNNNNTLPSFPSIPTTFLPAPISNTIALSSPINSNSSGNSSSTSKTDWACTSATNKQKETMKNEVGQNDKSFEAQLKAKGVQYNSTLGHGLATSAISGVTGGKGRCAHFVNDALEANGINAKRDNHAYTRASVLRSDKDNFTEIKLNNESDLRKLPAGSIVVYQPGTCNYSAEHGHTFVATGNGGGGSDHFQNSFRFPEDGKGISVFIPTSKIA